MTQLVALFVLMVSTALGTAVGDTLPVQFEGNAGRFDPAIRYVLEGGSVPVAFTEREMVFNTGRRAVRMRFSSAAPRGIAGTDSLPTVVNYFTADDRSKWRRRVPCFRGIRFNGGYEGIDVAIYVKDKRRSGTRRRFTSVQASPAEERFEYQGSSRKRG